LRIKGLAGGAGVAMGGQITPGESGRAAVVFRAAQR
jgi:hypothetical protein